MILIIIVVGFLAAIFFVSLYILRMLSRVKIKSTLRKKKTLSATEETIEAYKKLLRYEPSDNNTRIQLAKLYMENGNFTEAITQLNTALIYTKNNSTVEQSEIYNLLGQCHVKNNDLEEALKVYSLMRKIDPQNPTVYSMLGQIEKKLKNKKKAIAYFYKAFQLDPTNIEILRELSSLFFEEKKFKEAYFFSKKIVELNPEDTEANYYLAEINYAFGKLKDAYPHYIKARKEDRFTVTSILKIAKILETYNKNNEAKKLLVSLLKKEGLKREEILEIRYELGEIYIKEGDINNAILQWQKIMNYSTNYRDVRTKLDKYEHTKTNIVLRKYLMSKPDEFLRICLDLLDKFTEKLIVIRKDILRDSSVEILTHGVHNKVETTILFKFFRGTTPVGQLPIREFYERVKETKAKIGICFTSSEYTEEAYQFAEGRAIELKGKEELLKLLNKVSK
ncbi:MAG: hypothetical protein DRP54_04220 [Spirochaetes bacterium]|nr:MAG: hypothetical protein DRP54_04220 [Spirochaetota bacterium]